MRIRAILGPSYPNSSRAPSGPGFQRLGHADPRAAAPRQADVEHRAEPSATPRIPPMSLGSIAAIVTPAARRSRTQGRDSLSSCGGASRCHGEIFVGPARLLDRGLMVSPCHAWYQSLTQYYMNLYSIILKYIPLDIRHHLPSNCRDLIPAGHKFNETDTTPTNATKAGARPWVGRIWPGPPLQRFPGDDGPRRRKGTIRRRQWAFSKRLFGFRHRRRYGAWDR
jgi:hypothetical protein